MHDRHSDNDPDFAASLDDMLERVNSSSLAEQETRDVSAPAPAQPEPRLPKEPPGAPPPAGSGSKHAPSRARRATSLPARAQLHHRRLLAWGLGALVAVGLAWTGVRHPIPPAQLLSLDRLPPPAAGPVSAVPAVLAAASIVTPSVEAKELPSIAFDPDASTEALMLEQLRQRPPSNADATPGFAIARYDSLPEASRGWQVLLPIGVEVVYALVPVASHLRNLQDLRGRRINVGAPGSARARSSEALYRSLFGQPLPPAALRAASKDAALPAVLRGDGLDALLLFDGQPSSWLAALPEETRLQLRVLRLDPSSASTRHALRNYLPVSVAPTLVNEPTPVPTLGEVTFIVASSAQAAAPELVRYLCARLPGLKASGHPMWKELDPALQLPVQLPRSPDIASAVQACAKSPSHTSGASS